MGRYEARVVDGSRRGQRLAGAAPRVERVEAARGVGLVVGQKAIGPKRGRVQHVAVCVQDQNRFVPVVDKVVARVARRLIPGLLAVSVISERDDAAIVAGQAVFGVAEVWVTPLATVYLWLPLPS
jgi:hypothetical protein